MSDPEIYQPDEAGGAGDTQTPGAQLADLAQIITAYNDVTEKLQQSHEHMVAQVERLQAELASTDAQLQRSKRLAALGQMAAGIAHEIRNPLAAIRLYAGFIVEDTEALGGAAGPVAPSSKPLGTVASSARKIVTAVQGLDAIVNDVLSFSGEMRPSFQPVAIDTLVGDAIDATRPAIEAARHRVEIDLDNTARPELDPALMRQALVNIIRNAAEAMAPEPGLIRIEGRIEGARDARRYRLLVFDHGPGLSPDAIDRMFNPFFTTRSTGTGLGLAIVHRILEAHGGAVVGDNHGDNHGASNSDTGDADYSNADRVGETDGGHAGEPGGGGACFELNFPVKQAAGVRPDTHISLHTTSAHLAIPMEHISS